MGAPDFYFAVSESPVKSVNHENRQKVWKNHIFFNLIIFSQNHQICLTNAYNSMDYGLSQGNKQEMHWFYENLMLVHDSVFSDLNLICIFELRCPVKKLHSSAQSEIALKLQFSVWALQWYAWI